MRRVPIKTPGMPNNNNCIAILISFLIAVECLNVPPKPSATVASLWEAIELEYGSPISNKAGN